MGRRCLLFPGSDLCRFFRLGLPVIALLLVLGCGGTGDRPPQGLVVQGATADGEMPPAYAPKYVIHPNDELRIVVLASPELTSTSPVRPDGTITVPGAGEVQTEGLTPEELSGIIESRLTHLIRQPTVDVLVTRTAPPRFYVAGEVFSSGSRDLEQGMTMLHAVTLSGLRSSAKVSSVVLLRRTGEEEVVVRRVNLKDVINGKEGAVDPMLAPNDVVFVPKTFIASWSQFMTEFLRPASVPLDFYTTAWFAANVAKQNFRVTFQ